MELLELKRISLLYVEDDEDIRTELVELLEVYFAELHVAKDGQEGLELFNKHKPDIVVSDIQMPVMDGLAMCEEIRKINKDVPIIITTAFNDPSFLIRSIDIGVDKYVVKPINFTKLEDTLLRCATFVFQKRTIDDLVKLSKELMDEHDDFMYITGDDFNHINKAFLNFLGFNTIDEFNADYKTIFEKLQTISDQEIKATKEEWITFIKNNSEIDHIIYLKECNGDESKIIPYKVNVKHLSNIEHYLVVFNEVK